LHVKRASSCMQLIRFESLHLRRGQNSVDEITEAFARARALQRKSIPDRPPRLHIGLRASPHRSSSTSRVIDNVSHHGTFSRANRTTDDAVDDAVLTPHPPNGGGVGISVDSRLSEDDTWQFHTSWFRDGSRVWRWVAQVALLRAARAAISRADAFPSSAAVDDDDEDDEEEGDISRRRSGARISVVRVWSCGCSSGEEVFSTRMLWLHSMRPLLEELYAETHDGEQADPGSFVCTVLGTDRNQDIVNRAKHAHEEWNTTTGIPPCLVDEYASLISSQRGWKLGQQRKQGGGASTVALPSLEEPHAREGDKTPLFRSHEPVPTYIPTAQRPQEDAQKFRLRNEVRQDCNFVVQDATLERGEAATIENQSVVRSVVPLDPVLGSTRFDIIFCRYSIFLYCDTAARWRALKLIVERLVPGTGVLILGKSDTLPQGAAHYYYLVPCGDCPGAFRMLSAAERRARASAASEQQQQPATAVGGGSITANVENKPPPPFGGMVNALDAASSVDDFYRLHRGYAAFHRTQAFPAGPQDTNIMRVSEASDAILRASGKLDVGFEARSKNAEEKRTKALEEARDKKREMEEAERSRPELRFSRPRPETDMNFYERMTYYVEQRGMRIKEIRESMIEDTDARPSAKQRFDALDGRSKKKKAKKKKKKKKKKRKKKEKDGDDVDADGGEDAVSVRTTGSRLDELAQPNRTVLRLSPRPASSLGMGSPRSRNCVVGVDMDSRGYFTFVDVKPRVPLLMSLPMSSTSQRSPRSTERH
jgi:hypothetical protein